MTRRKNRQIERQSDQTKRTDRQTDRQTDRPECMPMRSRSGMSGMCRILNSPHLLRITSAMVLISPAWRLLRIGIPLHTMYASPMVSTCRIFGFYYFVVSESRSINNFSDYYLQKNTFYYSPKVRGRQVCWWYARNVWHAVQQSSSLNNPIMEP